MLVTGAGLPSAVSYNGSEVAVVVAFAVLGAAVSMTPVRRVALAVPIALAALCLVVSYTPLAASLTPLVERVDPDESGDAVFVFSSKIEPDGQPNASAMSRMFHGLELVARGRAPVFVVSEVTPGRGAEGLAQAWVDEFNLRAEVIDLGPVSNTHDEAVLLGKLARERGWKRIVAVTSPTHSRRACATLENEGLVAIASPARETMFELPRLEGADDRLRAFGQVVHELVGSWTYRRRGWIR
jgi:uncharacterized SAM-binding protein YcdF (DUF218 family)